MDLELILVDDGSTDNTPAVARHLASMDSRVHVLALPPVGIVEALRRGCALARGQYIARMDADDISHTSRLRKQVDLLDARPAVGLCGVQVTHGGLDAGEGRTRYLDWLNALVTPEDHARERFIECPIAHPTFCMRREVYEAVGGYRDTRGPEDYDLLLRIAAAGQDLAKVEEPLFEWRHSEGRLSMTDPRYAPERFRALKRDALRPVLEGHAVFHQWGAGEVGKAWLREWTSPRPTAVVDIHPRKVGKAIHGYDVIAPDDLPPPDETFVVVAVGAPGAREDIRAWMGAHGCRESQHFLFLA